MPINYNNMKQFRSLSCSIVALLLSCLATSCWMYKPELADIPLIDHKGDMRLNGALYFNPEPAFNDRIGYFFIPVPGISASFSAGISDLWAINTFAEYQGNVYYTHAAAGLYRAFNRSVLEGYLGLGYGHGHAYWDAEPASADIKYLLPFVQVNYGWHLNPHNVIGFSLKTGDYIPVASRINHPCEDPTYPVQAPLIEPQVFFRTGGEKVKFQLQMGYAHLFGWPQKGILSYHPLSISTGISITL